MFPMLLERNVMAIFYHWITFGWDHNQSIKYGSSTLKLVISVHASTPKKIRITDNCSIDIFDTYLDWISWISFMHWCTLFFIPHWNRWHQWTTASNSIRKKTLCGKIYAGVVNSHILQCPALTFDRGVLKVLFIVCVYFSNIVSLYCELSQINAMLSSSTPAE